MGLYDEIINANKKKKETQKSSLFDEIINASRINSANQLYEAQKKRVENINEDYQKDISKGLANTGIYNTDSPKKTDGTDFVNSVINKEQKTTQSSPFNIEENAKKIQEALYNPTTNEEREKLNKEKNTLKYNRYLKTAEDVSNEKTNWWDKTGGVVQRAISDLFENFSADEYKYKDEEGKTKFLPTYNQLKQEKVSGDYDTKVGKFLGDVGYQGTKILGSTALNAIVPGSGSVLYWTDMTTDSYKDAINQGYDTTNSAAYALANAGFEYATSKILGGATGKLTGGSARELDKAASNVFYKLTGNETVSRILGTAFSEGTEEFTQEYLDNISKLLLLENSTDLGEYANIFKNPEILEDALYSAAVGAATGGAIETTNGSDVNRNIKLFESFKEQIEERKANTTDKAKIEQYDKVIESIDNYLKKPFSIETETTENVQNQVQQIDDNPLAKLQRTNIEQRQQINQQVEQELQQEQIDNMSKKIDKLSKQVQVQNENAKGTPFNTLIGYGNDTALVQVKGDLQNINGVDVGIYKDSNENWHVVDLQSNFSLDRANYSTKKAAIENATDAINNFDLSQLRQNKEQRKAEAIDLTTKNKPETKNEYRGSHQIENAKKLVDLNINDIQSRVEELNGYLTQQDQIDLRKLNKIFNHPEEDIKVYRASPVNELNSGDWITTDKAYAKNVAQNNGGKVYEYTIKPSQLYYPNNVNDLPSLHRLSSFQYIENQPSIPTTRDFNKINLPTRQKVSLPTKSTTETKVQEKVEKAVKNKGIEALKKATNAGKTYLQLKQSEAKQLREDLRQYIGKTKEQLTNAKTYNSLRDEVKKFMEKEIEHLDYDMKQVKSQIRDTKIKIDDNLKEQITDYGDFRKSNFGKLKLGNTGQSIDSVYNELSSMYPYYFSEDIDTEADMLYELADFMSRKDSTIEKYNLTDNELETATTKIFNALVNNSLTNEQVEEIQKDLMEKYSKKTRRTIQEELLEDMGITEEDIQVGKDISSIDFQRTDPIRLNEKVFGAEVGQKINDATINKTKHNEAERTRFLNKQRNDIKELGIKPRSKESAAVQKYAEKEYLNDNGELVPYGEKELASEFKDETTRNKIKHAAEVIRNKYDEYIDNLNRKLTDMGYDPIPKRENYMPHFQTFTDALSKIGFPLNAERMSNDTLPTDINGITDQFKPGKNWFASAMQRKGVKTDYDAITGFDNYIEGASNILYHTEDIQRYRALSRLVRETYGREHGLDNMASMSNEELTDRLKDMFNNKLSKYAAWLDEQANSLAGKKSKLDRGFEEIFGRKVYNVLDAAKKQVGSNMTGFNVRSALTNFASAVQGASKTNKLAWLKGTISTMQNIIHKDGLIDKSDFLTSRFGSNQLSKKFWQKASNAGQIFMTGTDYFTANQIWRSKYYENLSKGMSESQAIKNADDFAARIMGDRSKGSTAAIFNSKTLGLLTQFQLEVNNQWSSIIHDNKMDLKTGNKSGATVVFQLGQLAAMSYLFNNLMKSLTGSDVMIDPIDMLKKILGGDDDDDKTVEERAEEAFGDLINDLPFVSFWSGGRIPISEAFKGGESFIGKLSGKKDKYGNDIKWDDVKKDLIESGFYWLLPTGYGQARKTSKGLSMYKEELPGSYTDSGNLRFTADTSTGGKIKSALFGQYSSKEAQKYIESGYKSISKARLDEVKELGMSASEYKKYREGLNNAGTTNKDKIDYIANSDYSNKEKNIMAKNVLGKDFDINEYKKYGNYEEYDYATKNPEKYSVIKEIAPYNKYTTYKDKITEIKNNTTNDKQETIKYINSLPLNVPQKAMLIKSYYKSFKQYDKQIAQYIAKQPITKKEKEEILTQLGFTIKDGRVYY